MKELWLVDYHKIVWKRRRKEGNKKRKEGGGGGGGGALKSTQLLNQNTHNDETKWKFKLMPRGTTPWPQMRRKKFPRRYGWGNRK
jgi:hypothetical protein